MPTTEIEKLERRYAENPQGLTFAPLAEIHRKNGDVSRALELLRAGLELHPNYIPASIVLGRCHWDLGDLPAAESAFAHVLRLDDENVIALKSLADINERLGRLGEAQRWLNRLIGVDRSNEEARQQLARLETAKQETTRSGSVASAPVADLPHEIAAADPVPEASVPQAVPASTSPLRDPAPTDPSSQPVPLDLTGELAEPPAAAAAPAPEAKSSSLEFLDTSEPPSQRHDASPPPAVDGLINQEFVPPKGASIPLHPELTQELVPSDEAFDRLEVETAEEVELRSSGASEFRVPNAAEDFLELASQLSPRDEGPPAPLPPPESRRSLERQEPAAAPLPSTALEQGPEPVEPAKASYAARDTKGQSVSSFFAALLAARPGGAGAAGGTRGTPTPRGVAPQVSDAALDAAVSFDEFFGSAASGPSPVPQTNAEQGKDDLDQFQSWLQNLKR